MSDKITKLSLYRPFVSNGIVSIEPFAFYLSKELALAHGQMLIDSGEVEDTILGEWQASIEEHKNQVPQQLQERSVSTILQSLRVVLCAENADFTEGVEYYTDFEQKAAKEMAKTITYYKNSGFTDVEERGENSYELKSPDNCDVFYIEMAPVKVRDLYSYLNKDAAKEGVYRYNEKKPMDIQFNDIIKLCDTLDAGERLDVRNFGCYGELDLHITKDSSYHREVDKDYNNLVTISTCWQGKWVDDTGDTYVTDGSLWDELARIFHYKDFSRDKEEAER